MSGKFGGSDWDIGWIRIYCLNYWHIDIVKILRIQGMDDILICTIGDTEIFGNYDHLLKFGVVVPNSGYSWYNWGLAFLEVDTIRLLVCIYSSWEREF